MPIPFVQPEPVEKTIDGVTLKFYPVSTRMLFQLRTLAKPVAKAIGALLSSKQNDIGKETVEVRSATDDYQIRTTLQPITADLAKARHEQMSSAIDTLADCLLSETAGTTLALLAMDSLRDHYPKGSATPQAAQTFLADTPAPTMVEIIAGVAEANKKLFDPLKARVADVTATLRSQLDGLRSEPSEANPTSNSGSTSSSPSP